MFTKETMLVCSIFMKYKQMNATQFAFCGRFKISTLFHADDHLRTCQINFHLSLSGHCDLKWHFPFISRGSEIKKKNVNPKKENKIVKFTAAKVQNSLIAVIF